MKADLVWRADTKSFANLPNLGEALSAMPSWLVRIPVPRCPRSY